MLESIFLLGSTRSTIDTKRNNELYETNITGDKQSFTETENHDQGVWRIEAGVSYTWLSSSSKMTPDKMRIRDI